MEARRGSNSATQESTVLDRNGRRGSPPWQALPLTFRTGSAEALSTKHCALFTVQALHCLVVLRCRALQSHPLLAHQSVKPRSSKSRHAAPGKNTNFEHGTIIWYRTNVNTILCRMQMCMGLLILCSAANELIFAYIFTVFTYLRTTTATTRPLPIALGVRLFSHDYILIHICLSQFCLNVFGGKIVSIDNSLLV